MADGGRERGGGGKRKGGGDREGERKGRGQRQRERERESFVCWLLYVPATWECISGADLLRQFYVLPH